MKGRLLIGVALVAMGILIGCMGEGGSLTGGTTTTGGTSTGGGGTTVPVSMTGMIYSPQVITAHAGDTIQWTNIGMPPHTVTSDTGQAGLDSSTQFPSGIATNGVFTWQVPSNATAGTNFFYHCTFHGAAGNGSSLGIGMSGEISVQ